MFRLVTNRRRYDDKTGQWVDAGTNYFTVKAWRGLADSVQHSLRKGEPVVVVGRLDLQTWRDDKGQDRLDATIHADSIGHDLSRGTAVFTSSGGAPMDKRSEPAARELESWAPADGEPVDLPF